MYVERGEDRLVTLRVPTLELWRAPRTVIWGGHPDRDVWIGSREDRQRERYRRMAAAGIRMRLVFRDAFTPAVKRAAEQMRQFSDAMEQSRLPFLDLDRR